MSERRDPTLLDSPVLAAMLIIACLPLGCASVHIGGAGIAPHRDGVWLPDAAPSVAVPGAVSAVLPHGCTPVVVPDPDLEDATGADFRRRALAQQRILRRGAVALPALARAWDAAPSGSDRARTLARLIEQMQRKLSPERLATEMNEAGGIRRLAAMRVAAAHGPSLVPPLLSLVTHRDPEVRREAVVTLRKITDRHPSASGLGPVHAIRVWRAWYDEACGERPLRPAPSPVTPDRPRPVSM